jgi:subtilase family serine protease
VSAKLGVALVSVIALLALTVLPVAAQEFTLTVAVLVNRSNAGGFTEYQKYPERYLEHLQIPYETIDVGTTAPPADLGTRQLIVAGHRGLAPSAAWQAALTNAVQAGTGFVNLDGSTTIASETHIQALFGATASTTSLGNVIVVPAEVMPDGASPHFIAGLQRRFLNDPAGGDLWYPFHDQSDAGMVTQTILTPTTGAVIARLGAQPLIQAVNAPGGGRAVHFGTYDYLKADRFGFLTGVDDLFWRSLVWAARKPFVLRGYPHLWAVQIDDEVDGWTSRVGDLYDAALTGTRAADGTGGPWRVTAFLFTDRVSPGSGERATMISDINAGRLQVSPHALHGDQGPDLYYRVPHPGLPPTDDEWLSQLNQALDWITGEGGGDTVPSISRSMVPHWWALADNTGYDLWHSLGFRYLTIRQGPGAQNLYGQGDPAGRLSARPFRLYEQPPIGGVDDDYPLFFADTVTVGSRTGLQPQSFFSFTTSVNRPGTATSPRPDFAWPGASTNLPGPWTKEQSLDQLRYWTWRLWSSQAPVNLYTHDSNNLERSTAADRQFVIEQGSQWLAAHGVRHVFMEELGDYLHARNTSTLVGATAAGGTITVTYTGSAVDADDAPIATMVWVYSGDTEGRLSEVPGFVNGLVFTLDGASDPRLAVSPTALSFTAAAGANPAPQSLEITSSGSESFAWTAASSAGWLGVSPSSGRAPSTATVSVDTTGLAAGTYSGAVTVTAPGAANSPRSIAVTLTLTPPGTVDLVATAVSEPPATAPAGQSVSVTDTVRNGGSAAAAASRTRYYLSADTLRGTGDQIVTGDRSVPALAAGAESTGTVTVTIPSTTPAGRYFLLACADDTLVVQESDETNNCRASSGTVQVSSSWDLQTTALTDPPATVTIGGVVSVTETVQNVGSATAAASTSRYYLSLDTVKNTGDVLLTGTRSVPGLAAGATSSGTVSATVPSTTAAGTYFLLACADDTAQVTETDETNNCRSSATALQVVATTARLATTDLSAPPATVAPGGSFSLTDTVQNLGNTTAAASTSAYALSLDAVPGYGDLALTGTRSVPSLAAGATSTGTVTVTVPSTTPVGAYHVFTCADIYLAVNETMDTANCRVSAGTVRVTAANVEVDLTTTVTSDPPATVTAGDTLSVTDTVENLGTETSGASTTRYYLSLDSVKSTGDALLTGTRSVPSLAAAATSTGTVTATVPATTAAGTYFLLACADDTAQVAETDETNNCRSSATTLQVASTTARLATTAVSEPPATVARGGSFAVTDTVENVGNATAGASTSAYGLSLDGVPGYEDRPLTGIRSVPSLGAGATSTGTVTLAVPSTTPAGAYFLFTCPDIYFLVNQSFDPSTCRVSAGTVQVE